MEELSQEQKDLLWLEWQRDMWDPFRGKYEDPTPRERCLILNFLRQHDFEEDDYVEGEDWKAFENKAGIPNLRPVIIKFLHDVRESKGYDLPCFLPFFDSPFMPCKIPEKHQKKSYDELMEATGVAIAGINAQTIESGNGKSYELVSVDKLVQTRNRMFLLTLTVKELPAADIASGEDTIMVDADADADGALKTVRAMVFSTPGGGFEFLEWKFKP